MLRYGKYFCVNLLLTAPTPLLVILSFSAIGRGAAVYSGLADGEWLRWIFCPLALVTILTLYLADGFLGSVPSTPTTKAMVDCDADAPPSLVPVDAAFRPNQMLPHPAAKVVFVLGLVFAILTWLFSASDYPSAPLILVIFAGPALVVFLSILSPARRFKKLYRKPKTDPLVLVVTAGTVNSHDVGTFGSAQAAAFFFHGTWVLSVWLLWVTDTKLGDGTNDYDTELRQRLEDDGITGERFPDSQGLVQMLLWMSPICAWIVLWTVGCLVLFNLHLHRTIKAETRRSCWEEVCADAAALSEKEQRQVRTIIHRVKLLTGVFALMTGITWSAASVAGASVSFAMSVQAFVAAFAFFMVIHVYLSLTNTHRDILARSLASSPLLRNAMDIARSDWGLALFLLPVAPLLPVYLVLSAVNQLVRRLRGHTRCLGETWLTARTTQQVRLLRGRSTWTGIHRKMQVLCILVVCLQVFGGIGTNVCLAWVNERLQGVSFYTLTVIYLMVGLGMFMIPVVPGVAVYLFGGIVIPTGYVREFGNDGDFSGSEFWTGFVIVVGLNFLLKLMAVSLQQKAIGEPMSTSLSILQMVGVNKPAVRAVEIILQRPGMSLPKVLVLVGGVDWPTSVLTGILRLSLFQMLLGTTPVIVSVATVSAAGAFRLREPESSTWQSFSSLMLSVAVCTNALLMVLVTYYVQDTWERYHEHLSKPQRKYLHVDWLDHVKALQQKKIDEMGAWNVLPLFAKILLVTTTTLFLSSSFTMVMLESYCWDDFKVTDQLDGFSFIEPLGFAALIVFCCCCFSYWAFGVGLSCTTRAARKEVVDALAPKREAWILERQELCPDDEDSEEQDLRLVVKQLRAELHRLQSRVHALERGEPPIETMVERADVKAAYSREVSSHDRGVERSPSEVSV